MAFTTDAAHARAEAITQPRANRLGLWLFFASESFLFAALISARFATSGTDRPAEANQALALGVTIVLLASSLSAYMAETAISCDRRKLFSRYTLLTIGLGLLFMVGVFFELQDATHYFPVDTIYGSAFFTLIGAHALHVLSGIIMLAIVWNLGRKGHYGAEDYWGVEGVVKYWHYVDLVWVFIYPTLYLF